MKKKVMIIPVGEQIKPLTYGLKFYKDIDEIILLYSKETEKQAKQIEKIFAATNIFSNIWKIKVNPKQITNILISLINFFKKRKVENIEIIGNLTGGTKPMSLAVYIFSIFLNGECFYIFKSSENKMEYVEIPTIRLKLHEEINKNSKKYKILEFLSKKKAKLREIAKFIRLKDSSTSYYLEKMQEKGYIRRNGYYYEITETGKLILYIIKILYGKSESYINSSRISRNSYRSYRILTKEI